MLAINGLANRLIENIQARYTRGPFGYDILGILATLGHIDCIAIRICKIAIAWDEVFSLAGIRFGTLTIPCT
jgi:hypothetical protein